MKRPPELAYLSSCLSGHGAMYHENNSNYYNNHTFTDNNTNVNSINNNNNNSNLVDGIPEEDRAAIFPIIKLAFPSLTCSEIESGCENKNQENSHNYSTNTVNSTSDVGRTWYAEGSKMEEVVKEEDEEGTVPFLHRGYNSNGSTRELIHGDVGDPLFTTIPTMSTMNGSRHGHTSLEYNFIISTPPPWNESIEKSEIIKGICINPLLPDGGIFLQESSYSLNLLMPESTKFEVEAQSNVKDDKLSRCFASDTDRSCTQASSYAKKNDATLLQCRRSNGKQWQCSRSASPGLMYCDLHQKYKRALKPIKELEKNATLSPDKQEANDTIDKMNVSEKMNVSRCVLESHGPIDSKNQILEKSGLSKEQESGQSRCHRKDGKLWQCANLALANSIYCDHHHKKRHKKKKKDAPGTVPKKDTVSTPKMGKLSENGEFEDYAASAQGAHRDAKEAKLCGPDVKGKQNHGHGCVEMSRKKNGAADAGMRNEASLSGLSPIVRNLGSIGTILDPHRPLGSIDMVRNPYRPMERCHRKDGKKWQCSKYCKPGFSYCEHHQGRLRKGKVIRIHDRGDSHVHVQSIPQPNVELLDRDRNTDMNPNTDTKAVVQCESKGEGGCGCSNENGYNEHRGHDQASCKSSRKCEEEMLDCSIAAQQCSKTVESSIGTTGQTNQCLNGMMQCPTTIRNGDISWSVESLFMGRDKDPAALSKVCVPTSNVYPSAYVAGDMGREEMFTSYKALLCDDTITSTSAHGLDQHQRVREPALLVSHSSKSSSCPYGIQMLATYAPNLHHQQRLGSPPHSSQNVFDYCIIDS